MTTIYGRLLRLYPKAYRDEFSGEMIAIFAELESEAAAQGLAARFRFVIREGAGLFIGVAQEHWRQFVTRRFTMRGEFRFPKATWILMTIILAGVLMAINKGEAISVSVPNVSSPMAPIHPASQVVVSWTLSFLLMYVIGVLVGGALFLVRRTAADRAAEIGQN